MFTKENKSTEGCSKLKSPETTQVQERLVSTLEHMQEQDKSSDIEQQPPFGDRKISNIQPQNRGGGVTKPTRTSYNFDKV